MICALAAVLALAACGAPAPAATSAAAATTVAAEPTATPTPEPTATPTATPEPTAAGLSGIDVLGKEIKLTAAPQRIVSLTPSNTEILFALGLGSKVIGVDAISNYPAEVANIEKVGDFNGPNLEKIAGLKPDLVLAGNKLQKDIIDKLQALGLTVAATEGTTYQSTYDTITLVGALTGAADQAKTLTDDMRRKEQIVKDAIKDKASDKSAYVCISYGQFGDYSAGPGTFPYEIVEMCGAKNLTEGMPVEWPQMSLEDIVKKDPAVVLLSSDLGDAATFIGTEGYKNLSASKNQQVFTVTSDTCMRPGPRLVEGFREFAQVLCGVTISFDK
jgi:iron complex transport system substrate-binding protein